MPKIPPAITNFISSHITAVVVILAAIILIFTVVAPFFRRLKQKRIKVKQTDEMMRDLKVWRHVSDLVKGGDTHSRAKELLASNIEQINYLMDQGFSLSASHGRSLYDMGWYILLGEPQSGKSSLMQKSELELVCASPEEAASEDGKNSFPIRIWLGGKGVVCDVSGRTFYDHWFGGSSAGWDHIIHELKKRRRKMPLNGIILTVPADALMADKEALCQQKAILMATELARLVNSMGICLPCYLAVTKLDMVNGFKEYTAGIAGELRHQIFGFENLSGAYSAAAFRDFWDALVERLRQGSLKSMLSTQIYRHGQVTASNRGDVTGKIYLFPENFDGLYKNLTIYLNSLFGENNFHGSKNISLEGVYFTSSLESGVTLSPTLANLAEKSADDIPLSAAVSTESRSYFVRDLLHKRIFPSTTLSYFTKSAEFKQHTAAYLISAAFLVLGAIFLYTAYFNADQFSSSLTGMTKFYHNLADSFRRGDISASPIITYTQGEYIIDNSPITAENVSRFQTYFDAYSYLRTKPIVPSGFKPASAFFFGVHPNIGYADRAFIFNQLHGIMVRMPVIEGVGEKLKKAAANKRVLNTELKGVINSFVMLSQVENADFSTYINSGNFQIEPLLRYILPKADNDTVNLLTFYQKEYDRKYTFTVDPAYFFSDRYHEACEAAIKMVLDAWKDLRVYPDSRYGRIKELVNISKEVADNYLKITTLMRYINSVTMFNDLEGTVNDWRALIKRQETLIFMGSNIFNELAGARSALNTAVSSNGDLFGNNRINDFLFDNNTLNSSYKEFSDLFESDMSFVERMVKSTQNRIPQNQIDLGEIAVLRDGLPKSMSEEVNNLKSLAVTLKSSPLYSKKVDDNNSLFFVVEKLLEDAVFSFNLDDFKNADFDTLWRNFQLASEQAAGVYENYAKTYEKQEDLAELVINARNMLLAQSYVAKARLFDAELTIIETSEADLAAFIEANAKDTNLFDFSDDALNSSIGGVRYNKSFDPEAMSALVNEASIFASAFTTDPNDKTAPAFLQKNNRYMYKTTAFRSYLSRYIHYWGSFPERAYIPAHNWSEYRGRILSYRSYQIDAVLQAIYKKCVSILTEVDDSLLNDSDAAAKKTYLAALSDRLNILASTFNKSANSMLTAWAALPEDPDEALRVLQTASDDVLKVSYMAAYADHKGLGIGWWDDFISNGVNLLKYSYNNRWISEFSKNITLFK
ncbi:MAG: hypothetical protein LBP51_01690, partial [Deferribacteraceae bacterium]|nr:hypothetical protein [Deferribacteraceae bacterium]